MVDPLRRRALATGLCAFCCLLVLAIRPARSQHFEHDPRSITGSVTDHSHEPLRGAVVQLEQDGTMAVQTYITDERGIYHFRNLRGDSDYTVWANFRGQHSGKEALSKFDHKADRVINLVVRPGKD